MKPKQYEKEMDKRLKTVISNLSTILSLYEDYEKEASSKRQNRFEKKLMIKYSRSLKKLEKKAESLDII